MRTMTIRRWAGLVLAASILVACGEDDVGPDPDTTGPGTPGPTVVTPEEPTSTESADPGPGPTPWPEPTRPAAMEREDIEGAKAAAEYFLALYPYVYVTGDLAPWHEISHPECQFCSGVVDNVEELHADGGYADGPALEVTSIEAMPPDSEYEYFAVWIDGVEAPSSRFSGEGEVLGESEGSIFHADMALTRTANGWSIRGAVVEPQESGDEA